MSSDKRKSRSFPAQTAAQQHHRAQTAKAMRKLAVKNKCPHCERKSALKRTETPGFVFKTCRWCGYSRSIDTADMTTVENFPKTEGA